MQAYIEAMPGWKSELGSSLDEMIVAQFRRCRKPSSGTRPSTAWRETAGSSTSTASRSTSKWRSSAGLARADPAGRVEEGEMRYLDIREDVELDEKQFTDWVKQASRLPGEKLSSPAIRVPSLGTWSSDTVTFCSPISTPMRPAC